MHGAVACSVFWVDSFFAQYIKYMYSRYTFLQICMLFETTEEMAIQAKEGLSSAELNSTLYCTILHFPYPHFYSKSAYPCPSYETLIFLIFFFKSLYKCFNLQIKLITFIIIFKSLFRLILIKLITNIPTIFSEMNYNKKKLHRQFAETMLLKGYI